jgi:flavorubredoxin
MGYRKINENVLSVGVIDWDRRLFDNLIPLPDGTSYNAYLITGSEKTALIDTVDPDFTGALLQNIKDTGVNTIDYIISNHAEQDHSGSIPAVLEEYPQAEVLTSKKGKGMLKDLLKIKDEKIKTVGERDTISLGDKTLEFIETPLVHWPETISTYLQEDKILFSCDFLGSHLATSDLFVTDEAEVYRAAKRYYAEIMMPFRKMIVRNLDKLDKYDFEIVAPSHGPVHSNPEMIINVYKDWVSGEVKSEVVVPYVSMHGSTKEMIELGR